MLAGLASLIDVTPFRGKKIKAEALKNVFFLVEIVRGTYINLYLFESSMKWPFLDILNLRGYKNL